MQRARHALSWPAYDYFQVSPEADVGVSAVLPFAPCFSDGLNVSEGSRLWKTRVGCAKPSRYFTLRGFGLKAATTEQFLDATETRSSRP